MSEDFWLNLYQIKMLIRHIAKQHNLQSLKEPFQRLILEEPRDYSSYLNRTLNPETPSDDILISSSPSSFIEKKNQTAGEILSARRPTFLMQEYPQTLQEYTTAEPLYAKQTQRAKNLSNYQKRKANKEREQANWSCLVPSLNNKAYLRRKVNHRFSSLEKTSDNLGGPVDEKESHQDQALSNNGHKWNSRNRQMFSTLQRIKSKRSINQNQNQPELGGRKYKLQLPLYDGIKKPSTNEEEGQNEDRPLSRKKTMLLSQLKLAAQEMTSHTISPIQHLSKASHIATENKLDHRFQGNNNPEKHKTVSEEQRILHLRPKSELLGLNNKKESIQPVEKSFSLTQTIQISYRVSLPRLRQICSLGNLSQRNVVVKIPEIFAYPLFKGNQPQEELFVKASQLIKHLQIKVINDISIKKYTNCLLIIAGNIAILWHYNGKIYFGGWKHDFLDEGCKQGLGLEWLPNRYVYYGEFTKNKRQGVGVMKNSGSDVLAGVWRENKFVRSLCLKLQSAQQGQDPLTAQRIS